MRQSRHRFRWLTIKVRQSECAGAIRRLIFTVVNRLQNRLATRAHQSFTGQQADIQHLEYLRPSPKFVEHFWRAYRQPSAFRALAEGFELLLRKKIF